MTEAQLLRFLVQLLVVLGLARVLGEAFRRLGQPPLAGEILAGALLGQTVLGSLFPAAFDALFPADPVQRALFDVTAQIGILFLLLAIGLEVDVASAWKLRRQSLAVAVTGVVVPLGLGFGVALARYDAWAEVAAPRAAFALLVGAAVSITAITVVARLLFDLRIAKSDLGLLLISAMAINDLLGWAVLAVVLSLAGGSGSGPAAVAGALAGAAALAAFGATLGRGLVTRLLRALDARGFPNPATPLSTVVCLGLACGVASQLLGIHAVFGFLIAGLMAGDHRALSEHTRSVITQMVEAIFVPLYFAGICLHVDFAAQFTPGLVAAITALSIGGKFAGAWFGTRLVAMPAFDRLPVAIAHIPGGSMGVLLAAVAREQGVIGPQMFVAVVFASIVSSLLVGPALVWSLRRREARSVFAYLPGAGVVAALAARDRFEAIDELAARAAGLAGLPEPLVRDAVRAREDTMSTGMGQGLAFPHARLAGLARPLLLCGRSREGLEWNAFDERPAQLVFLILTPADEDDSQLEILATLARALAAEEARAALLRCDGAPELRERLREMLASAAPGPGV